jgi:hypothetical protein
MPVETPAATKAKKPIYKRWWAIALAAIFVIGGISQATGGGDDANPVADKPAACPVCRPGPAPGAARKLAQHASVKRGRSLGATISSLGTVNDCAVRARSPSVVIRDAQSAITSGSHWPAPMRRASSTKPATFPYETPVARG